LKQILVSEEVQAMLYLLKARLHKPTYSEVIHQLIRESPYKEFSRSNIWEAFKVTKDAENEEMAELRRDEEC